MDAGLSALRLILRGTFDRYPDLQLVLGHGAAAVEQFFDAIPDPADRSKIASGNAKTLFRLD